MAVENDNSNQNETAAGDLSSEIAAHNAGVDAGETEKPGSASSAALEEEAAPDETDETDETEGPTEEAEGDDSESDAGDDSGEFSFTPDADAETLAAEESAYLETVEITPQLQQMLDRRDAQIRQLSGTAETFGTAEQIGRVMTSVNKLFETSLAENGAAVAPNAKPLVELLRTDYKNEFPAIARELFEADSTTHQGMSVFEEILIENLGATPDKIRNIQLYLEADAPLPLPPPPTPAGIDGKLADAWKDFPEQKRFEVESILDDIKAKQAKLAETDNAYFKSNLQNDLGELQAKLNGELGILQKIQFGINSERAAGQTQARQAQAETIKFESSVIETTNTEIFALAETFSNDISGKLTFLDEDMRLPQARAIEARIMQALERNPDGTASPTAQYVAKQLKEEGVQFDFNAGRHLLNNLQTATRKVLMLERTGASQPAIDNARREKTNILKDIKSEKNELLGQITAKYVKSSGSAISKKVAEIQRNKQKTRGVMPKGSASVPRTGGDVDKEIANYNRQVKSAIQNGDLDALEDTYA